MGQTYVWHEKANTLASRDYKQPQAVLVLNDQGGAVMDVSYDKTGTLRAQMGGHPPIVLSVAENQQACVTLREEKINALSAGGASRDRDIHVSW